MHQPTTRRGLLQATGILAALAAVPAIPTAAQAAIVPPGTIDASETRRAECFHLKVRPLVDEGRLSAAHHAVDAALMAAGVPSRKAFELMSEYEDAESQYWLSHLDAYVEQLCRHLPGLAPALRAIAWHLNDAPNIEGLSCCEAPRGA